MYPRIISHRKWGTQKSPIYPRERAKEPCISANEVCKRALYIHRWIMQKKKSPIYPQKRAQKPYILLHMGWLRLVGSLKLQVSFAEYRLFHKAVWQKRPIILRSLLIVATPHINVEELDKITCLFCRILSLLQSSFAKETYNLIDPTDRSHLIPQC